MVITERLAQLRRSMAQRGMDGYVVVTDDFHGSEYVGDYFKARAYLSGFTGSAGRAAGPRGPVVRWPLLPACGGSAGGQRH